MNWRRAILTGVLAAGLSLSLVPRASADPPPWAGKWRHHHVKDDKWDRAAKSRAAAPAAPHELFGGSYLCWDWPTRSAGRVVSHSYSRRETRASKAT